jgi:transcriptional regulator with XRE-family HTH domain
MSTSTTSPIRDRAIKLLGSGINPEQTAHALGVEPSRISQLLSDQEFALEVTNLRFQNLARASNIDATYDTLEEKLQKKLADVLCFMTKPGEILAALRIVNGAKRRGASTQSEISNPAQVVTLNIPVMVVNKFVTTINNQVVRAGDRDLVTIPSAQMRNLLESSQGVNRDVKNSNPLTISAS